MVSVAENSFTCSRGYINTGEDSFSFPPDPQWGSFHSLLSLSVQHRGVIFFGLTPLGWFNPTHSLSLSAPPLTSVGEEPTKRKISQIAFFKVAAAAAVS